MEKEFLILFRYFAFFPRFYLHELANTELIFSFNFSCTLYQFQSIEPFFFFL